VKYKKSYLTSLMVLLMLLVVSSGTKGQSIYLDSDIEYVSTGVGTEFVLELKVDAAVTSLKSFTYYVTFDETKLDTIEVQEGDLLPTSGQITYFYAFIIDGNELQLEGLIMGAGEDVAGPGTLATIRFVTLDTGTVHLDVVEHRLRDVGANLIPSTAVGGTVHINVPPEPFDLIAPIEGATKSGLPGDFIPLSWNASNSLYPGENTTYTMEYSTSASFEPGETSIVPGVTGPSYQLDVDDMAWGYEGTYYWRVTAIGDVYGWERLCTPDYETFEFSYTAVAPDPFDLIAPADAVEISGAAGATFDWEDATSVIPDDQVSYIFYLATHPTVQDGLLLTEPVTASELLVSAGLPRNQELYWRVAAEGNYGMVRFSTSIFSVTFLGCCVGRVGDANNSGDDEPTIGDVSTLIDLLFISGIPLECWAEGDINQSGGADPDRDDITIGDVSILIDYLFITGSSLGLPDCL